MGILTIMSYKYEGKQTSHRTHSLLGDGHTQDVVEPWFSISLSILLSLWTGGVRYVITRYDKARPASCTHARSRKKVSQKKLGIPIPHVRATIIPRTLFPFSTASPPVFRPPFDVPLVVSRLVCVLQLINLRSTAAIRTDKQTLAQTWRRFASAL